MQVDLLQTSAVVPRMRTRVAEPRDVRLMRLRLTGIDGAGTVRINDSVWRVIGPDAPAGTRIKVTRADAATLVVDPAAA